MESAIVAKKKLENASGEDEKKYLESKIVDFKIYCAHYLVHTNAMSRTITNMEEDITAFDIWWGICYTKPVLNLKLVV